MCVPWVQLEYYANAAFSPLSLWAAGCPSSRSRWKPTWSRIWPPRGSSGIHWSALRALLSTTTATNPRPTTAAMCPITLDWAARPLMSAAYEIQTGHARCPIIQWLSITCDPMRCTCTIICCMGRGLDSFAIFVTIITFPGSTEYVRLTFSILLA
jgi:hypothetical protein